MEKFVKDLLTDELLDNVASLYDLVKTDLFFVGGFENFIYGFVKNDINYVIRMTHSSHRSLEEVEAEINFIFYLAENKAHVSTPILTSNNKLVERIACDDNSYFMITAFTKAKGKAPSKATYTDKMIFNYGKTIGSFHKLTRHYLVPENAPRRKNWDEDTLITDAAKYLPESEHFVITKLKNVIKQIKSIKKSDDNFGLIHTDFHMGNFFVNNDELSVFDFDDAAYQYFISDLAIALFYLVFLREKEEQIAIADHFMPIFMKGYLSEFKLSYIDYLTMPIFLKLRELILYIVIYRTLDVDHDPFAKIYLAKYRNHIKNDEAFIKLDFAKYYDSINK